MNDRTGELTVKLLKAIGARVIGCGVFELDYRSGKLTLEKPEYEDHAWDCGWTERDEIHNKSVVYFSDLLDIAQGRALRHARREAGDLARNELADDIRAVLDGRLTSGG